MKQTPEEIARLWVAQFDERLGWLDQTMEDMTLPEMVAVLAALEARGKSLSDYLAELRDRIVGAMDSRGTREATTRDLDGKPLVVAASRKPRRTNVDRDSLVSAAERAAATSRTPDPNTGELEDANAAITRVLKSAFRLEPRWTELAKLGIDQDEYCETTWSNSLTIKEGTEL